MGSTTNTWTGGSSTPADFNSPADWSGNSAPGANSTADIGTGFVVLTSADALALPGGLTLDVGASQSSFSDVPTSTLEVIDGALPSSLTIDNQFSGGSLVFGGKAPLFGSTLLAAGSVTSNAAINVGPGDVEYIAMAEDQLNNPGYFDNLGTIDVTGNATNYAGLAFVPAATPFNGANASATYGDIVLKYGILLAAASDVNSGQIVLNDGSLVAATADLQHTNVTFADATDTLAIGQNPAGTAGAAGAAAEYAFGGVISGFQSGDVIGLMENGIGATPASLSYSASNGVLTIDDASGNSLGALNIPGVDAKDSFILTQQPSGPDWRGYTSQYDISLADVWGGASGVDFNTGTNWVGGAAPVAGGVAEIGTGQATLDGTTANETPDAATIVLGAYVANLAASSSKSSLAITNDSLGAGETIDATLPGGSLSGGSAMLGSIGVNGAVNFAGTINVGAGDALAIGIAASSSTNPGYFDNTGTINVTGASSNYAFMEVKQGNQGTGSATGASAAYGTVNLSDAIFYAMAPDSGAGSPTNTGAFNLSNGSVLAVVGNAVLGATIVNFQDATDTLAIGQDSAGQYQYSGAINGFQAGDVIGLLSSGSSPAIPSYAQYNSTTGELAVFSAAGTQIGQLHLVGDYTTAGFSVGPPLKTAAPGYSSQYDITYTPPDIWVSGVTGEFDTPSNWSNAAMPQTGATAILQTGSIVIDNTQFLPSSLTLDVGTSVASIGATSQSNIDLTQFSLPSDMTIDNTAPGGTISATGVAGQVIESALNVTDSGTSYATINVGAGDVELIDVTTQSATSGPAFFDNEGVITLKGTASNYAVAIVSSSGANSAANSAFYGAVELSHGFLDAGVSDAPVAGFTPGPGTIDLGDASVLFASAALQDTNVRFDDASGDTLSLAPQGSGSTYQFGGAIYGFQQGDVIALDVTSTSATPTSVTYASGTHTLTIWDNSTQLGQLNVVGDYGANSFSLGPKSASALSSGFGYAGQYDITVTPQPYTWTSGAIADFTTSADWTGGAPPDGSTASPTVATLNQGTIQILATDTAPNNIIFDAGALNLNTQTTSTPTSVLAVTDNSLLSGVTIDATMPGGSFNHTGNGNADLYLSGLDIYGQVNFAGTINVGAGDGEFITISPDSSTTATPGYFNNTGTINLNGTAGENAAMVVAQGGPNANFQAGGYANYGNVNLSNGFFEAEAPDSSSNPLASGNSFNLGNNSLLVVVNTVFNNTTVTFADGTDVLALGEDASNQYMFGGGVNGVLKGLQAGDAIALEENGTSAVPTSLSYSAGVLSVSDANGVIGQIHISDPTNSLTTANFVASQSSNALLNGSTGEYGIRFVNVLNSLDVPTATTYDLGQPGTSEWRPGYLNVLTNVTVEGALDIDSAVKATGGSLLDVGGALTVNSGGSVTIGSGAAMTSDTNVTVGSLSNAGQIDLAGTNNSGNNYQALLTVNSSAGTGQDGILSGQLSLSGAAEVDFASGAFQSIASGGELSLSGYMASVDVVTNSSYVNAFSSLATIDAGGVLALSDSASLYDNGALDNKGSIEIDTSAGASNVYTNLTVFGELTNSGAIDLGSTSANLQVGGLANESGATINLAGTLQSSGAASNDGQIKGDGTLGIYNTLTNNSGGTIDANVSGGVLSLQGNSFVNNGVLEADGGALNVGVGVTGSGSAIITQGGTLQLNTPFNQNVAFQGPGALVISLPPYFGTITGFGLNKGAGNSIDLAGLAFNSNGQAVLNSSTDVLTVTEDSQTYTLQFDSSISGDVFHLASYNNGSGTQITAAPPCYCSGTQILTEYGEVAVENLSVGDHVVTARGERRPIVWIGHRTLDLGRHRYPLEVFPVRVRKNAFGDGMPRRDLWLSPRHAVFVDGVLIPVIQLANGATITQERVDHVGYWHVELESHDILLAEGLPAESFLDCGSRSGFANDDGCVELHPTFAPKSWDDACAPLRESGAEVDEVRRRLLARAQGAGFRQTRDPKLHVEADGRKIWPERGEDGAYLFDLPAGARDIRLVSRSWRPADDASSAGDDQRHLGLPVLSLEIDGRQQDLAALGKGWHDLERDASKVWRWTDGSAVLPASGRKIAVAIGDIPLYWVATDAHGPQLRLRVDGEEIWPERGGDGEYLFFAPQGARDIQLVSRTFRARGDCRLLGAPVTALEIDGACFGLEALGEGWRELEGEPGHAWRWTDGSAALPAGAKRITVKIGPTPFDGSEDETGDVRKAA